MATPKRYLSRKAKQLNKNAPYKSGLEAHIAKLLSTSSEVRYETDKLVYEVPASLHKYTPDFKLKDGVYIEGKGRLLPSERKKHLIVKEQNPDVVIHFFFDNADKPIYKGSPTSYRDWCEKYGFECTDKRGGLPKEWLL